jgi:hypothetical protein
MKHILFLFFLLAGFSAMAQRTEQSTLISTTNEPIFFVDNIRTGEAEVRKLKPSEIQSVSVYKDAKAVKLAGPEAQGGLVYIKTKAFAKKKKRYFFIRKNG